MCFGLDDVDCSTHGGRCIWLIASHQRFSVSMVGGEQNAAHQAVDKRQPYERLVERAIGLVKLLP
jgi:hypothetical protein